MTGPAGSVLVVIPTYDEVANVELVVHGVRDAVPEADVLIVDDSSPDGTGQVADAMAAADPRVRVLHRAGKDGLGAAYRAGFGWGLARGYDVLAQMDADLSHQPAQLATVLAGLDTGADLSVGSRWVPGGAVRNWPRRRKLLSRVGNTYIRLVLGLTVRDATSGFRALRRGALEAIGIDEVASQGYCFQVDVARRVAAAGLSTVEVPILFVERERGYSKLDGVIVREALWRVTAWGLVRFAERVRSQVTRLPYVRGHIRGER